jgi:hypothetical protein
MCEAPKALLFLNTPHKMAEGNLVFPTIKRALLDGSFLLTKDYKYL